MTKRIIQTTKGPVEVESLFEFSCLGQDFFLHRSHAYDGYKVSHVATGASIISKPSDDPGAALAGAITMLYENRLEFSEHAERIKRQIESIRVSRCSQ